ncbi:dynein light chain Tctex-type 3 [Gastrophryne carolinensis]
MLHNNTRHSIHCNGGVFQALPQQVPYAQGSGVCVDAGSQHQAAFSSDEASCIVKECVDIILGEVDYDETRVNEWMSAVVEQSLTHLVKLERAFKYIGRLVLYKTQMPFSAKENLKRSCSIRWENRTMYCIVNVFAVAIQL